MSVIILGGIYGGVFTPTEAAVVAVVYTIIIGLFVYKELDISQFPEILKNSFVTTTIVMSLIGFAGIFNWIIVRSEERRVGKECSCLWWREDGSKRLVD